MAWTISSAASCPWNLSTVPTGGAALAQEGPEAGSSALPTTEPGAASPAPEVAPELGVRPGGAGESPSGIEREDGDPSEHQDRRAEALDDLGDVVEGLLVGHRATVSLVSRP